MKINNLKQDKKSIMRIKKQLDWYISEASEEEYDEEMVATLQNLLDKLEPMENGNASDVDEAWEHFWTLVEEKDIRGVLFAEADEAERDRLSLEKKIY